MARRRTVVFGTVVALLWFSVLWTAGELCLVFKARNVQKTNRYVLATPHNGFCPDLDENGNPMPRDDGIVDGPPGPRPNPVVPDETFGPLFLSLDEEDRTLSATLKGGIIVLFDGQGEVRGTYNGVKDSWDLNDVLPLEEAAHADTPSAPAAEQLLNTVRRCTETGEPAITVVKWTDPGGERQLELKAYPVKDTSGTFSQVVAVFGDITGRQSVAEAQAAMNAGMAARWVVPFFEYRKNMKPGGRWQSNNMGFRDDDVILPKPPGVFRIACVGGSSTEEGRLGNLTYPNMLEKMLSEVFNGAPAVDVVNCGISGLDSAGERKRTLDYVALQPDLVIEQSGGNDICHTILPRFRDEASLLQKILRHSWLLRRWCPGLFAPQADEVASRLSEYTIENLRTMNGAFKKHNIPMVVCSLPAPDYDNLSPEERDYFEWDFKKNWQGYYFSFADYCCMVAIHNDLLRKFCEEENVRYVPVAEGMKSGVLYFGDICHLRQKGIQRKAEIIYEHVKPLVR